MCGAGSLSLVCFLIVIATWETQVAVCSGSGMDGACGGTSHASSQSWLELGAVRLKQESKARSGKLWGQGGLRGAVTALRLRGGRMGPNAKLEPTEEDIIVHHRCLRLPPPDHGSVKSALHRSRVHDWNGRRIYVAQGIPDQQDEDMHRYSWKGFINIGSMPGGSGNHSVMRLAGDDKVQLWGKWQFQGPCVGIFQGLYDMYLTYGPYKPLMVVSGGAQVLFEQCEIRNFGGKCIVAKYFSEVTLDWCTVGGSAGSMAPDYHKRLQIWDDKARGTVINEKIDRAMMRPKKPFEKKKDREFKVDWGKQWSPGWAKFASDGVSVESGSWLTAHRVCFEDTGRIMGAAVRGVGHAIINLHHCRFQRNRINLAADATVRLTVKHCHQFSYDKDRLNTPGYRGERTEFHAKRALRLPGNGTSTLEAQKPTNGPHILWREVNATNRYWKSGMEARGVDPARQRKRLEQRKERKAIRSVLRERGVDASKYLVHASHQDFTAFNDPSRGGARREANNPVKRHARDLKLFEAPDTLKDTGFEKGSGGGGEWVDPNEEMKAGGRRWDDELGIGISSEDGEGGGGRGAGGGDGRGVGKGRGDDLSEGQQDQGSAGEEIEDWGVQGDSKTSSD